MKICIGPIDATPDIAEEVRVAFEDIVLIYGIIANQALLG